MIIPLTARELAGFLNVSMADIRTLWEGGLLRRTVACPYRPTGAIVYSSPLDALEYWLTSGNSPKRLSPKHATLWVNCLAEAIDQEGFLECGLFEQTMILHQAAAQDRLTHYGGDSREIAETIIDKYHRILAIIEETDAMQNGSLDAHFGALNSQPNSHQWTQRAAPPAAN